MYRSARKTKIIATLGPATSSPEMILKLSRTGVDLFRINFSHGTHDEKAKLIDTIRHISAAHNLQIGLLADLQGPKIRTGKMADGALTLVKGEMLEITTADVVGRNGLISTTYRALPKDVAPGSRILLDDGSIELKVQSAAGDIVSCRVVEGGILTDNKGMNLPGVPVSAPSLTEKDLADLDFCLGRDIDFIALSFVRKAADIVNLKRIIKERNRSIPVIAKIEKPEAIRNFAEVLAVADAIMVARGDLGVELRPERVPLIQKKIIRMCNEAGKPVITATQMLESMISHHTPTRAETSDVANAILDGTDAVMLSGETAVGRYPVEAVSAMVKVAKDIEKSELWHMPAVDRHRKYPVPEAVAEAACHAASTLKAKAIIVFTQSGTTAALISRVRPLLPILAITPDPQIQRRLSIYWGVRSSTVRAMEGTDQQIEALEKSLLAGGFKKGDLVVIIMGAPIAARCSTNLVKVHKLGMADVCGES